MLRPLNLSESGWQDSSDGTRVSIGLTYDSRTADEISRMLSLPRVALYQDVDSTMDIAHSLAADGAPAGTLVLAESQRAGRGRGGRRWVSPPGGGLWFTLIERPSDASALDVLSLRIGLRVAAALDGFARAAVGLKWPNDLYLHGAKLGGILVESRWREGHPDWVAIGIGVNFTEPSEVESTAALGTMAPRSAVLSALIPAARGAAEGRGHLSDQELAEFGTRDVAAGRACVAPRHGRVAGISADGALLVVHPGGVDRCRDGSLVLEEDDA